MNNPSSELPLPAELQQAFDKGAARDEENPVASFLEVLKAAIVSASLLNADPGYRSRELSLAITNLEQAAMWAERGIK